ncbi:hypothetical protein BC936DRAFT_137848 [Jimgerdemannia flammicorona]|uniref:SMP-LTD domain-containing protein n=1 Tax=Jimgerdemannia flammicorona TaxID=994334 RepID=A0A433CWJ2_9FUNG|nr:hypothetical protein BC936DRAFT_137848 [Jimgerdemannia flammicorona]
MFRVVGFRADSLILFVYFPHQANPMHTKKKSEISAYTRPGILAADQPLVVPMLLRISDVKLRGIIVLVVSKQKGITLVFKNDPLEKILVSSTFDSISPVRNFLQTEIEKQLRTMFQEDLPTMIHNLSIKWVNGEQEKKKRQQEEEAQKLRNRMKLNKHTPPGSFHEQQHSVGSISSPYPSRILDGLRNSTALDIMSMPELTGHQISVALPGDGLFSGAHPDVDSDDGIPDYVSDGYPYDQGRFDSAMGVFSSFSDLYKKERGLKKLVERSDFYHSLEAGTRNDRRPSVNSTVSLPTMLGSGAWQRKPAPAPTSTQSDIGGGRHFLSPRSVSPMHPARPAPVTAENLDHHNRHLDHRSRYDGYDRYSDSLSTGSRERDFSSPRGHSASSSVIYEEHNDTSGSFGFGNDDELRGGNPDTLLLPQDQEIVLQPSRNAMAAQLAQLMNSNHTISPYTPTVEHYTSRSNPHQPKSNGAGASAGKKKVGKRKVIHLAGGFGSMNGSGSIEPSAETNHVDDRSTCFVSWERRPTPSTSTSSVTAVPSSRHHPTTTTLIPPKRTQRSMSDPAPSPAASVSTPLRAPPVPVVLSPRPVLAPRARQHPVLVTEQEETVEIPEETFNEIDEGSDDDPAVVTPPAMGSPSPGVRGAEFYGNGGLNANIGNNAKSVRANGDGGTFRLMGLGVAGAFGRLTLS